MFITPKALEVVLSLHERLLKVSTDHLEAERNFYKAECERLTSLAKHERRRADGAVDRLLVKEAHTWPIEDGVPKTPPEPTAVEIQRAGAMKKIFDEINAVGEDAEKGGAAKDELTISNGVVI